MAADNVLKPLAHDNGGEGVGNPSDNASIGQSLGCTLTQYADRTRLPVGFLRGLGLADLSYMSAPAVRIPYRDADGEETAVRFRTALERSEAGGQRFRWRRTRQVLGRG